MTETLKVHCFSPPGVAWTMQRYDRQERLWSKTGQQDLGDSHIWAIGDSLSMFETLKNLVLAGIGKVTLTRNSQFPLSQCKSRTESFKLDLSKLNPNVVIVEERGPLSPIDVIIKSSSDMKEGEYSDSKQVPKIIVSSNAMIGKVTVDFDGLASFPIIEPHPSSGLADLRFKPGEMWPEYQAFCDSIDLDSIDEYTHRHVPFCVLIAKAASRGEEATSLQNLLNQMERFPDEDNFSEARRNIWKLKLCTVPPGLNELLEHAKTINANKGPDTDFWGLVEVLNNFVKIHGCLPVSGIIPDMTSSTEMYTKLKSIYERKAEADVETIMQLSAHVYPKEAVRRFCRNARHLRAFVSKPTLEADDDIASDGRKLIPTGGTELAPIAALIGGLAAQEVTKVITRQYTPMSGTLIFNGETQSAELLSSDYRLIN